MRILSRVLTVLMVSYAIYTMLLLITTALVCHQLRTDLGLVLCGDGIKLYAMLPGSCVVLLFTFDQMFDLSVAPPPQGLRLAHDEV